MDEPKFNVNVTPGISIGMQAEIDILREQVVQKDEFFTL